MGTLTVDLGDRSYPIYVGQNLLGDEQWIRPHIKGNQVCVVTNETIAPLYLDKVVQSLQGLQVSTVVLPDGESHKNLEVLSRIFDQLLSERHNRTTTLIALGGGVVGDMTGFAAASYQRGVDFVQIPTTLLAQVDSSVGGKTGVNHPLGKNMIGAFHQPNAVIIDTDVLGSLPQRELSAGIAEVIKYGLIADAPFFEWLESNIARLMACDAEALAYSIERSCQNKADVVAKDEREGGIRAILNLGHTFGHAIETAQGYGEWLHGEAVAAGMVMAVDLSIREGWLPQSVQTRLVELLNLSKLPTKSPDDMDEEQFLSLMSVDKKVLDGQLRLVLLKALGEAVVSQDFSVDNLRQTLLHC
ncbi:3-dehydroquinate synthase [Pseudomaricurvus alkylphenolicus]|jgi:3-dehydroquinate synthase|uniref:3-dehydroquinate synthase n=1 Tax=Pseudomaricurvus alkylphenolicus TaxID=1306991 RepID=UPI00142142ED|nr:3-dehydroquinate synthase [Pseudomaricurvus alkylphenolicus]NIB39341.1 3-dehydroquinate synthase [Pseudomaricurvus alkylphenolicus]